MVQVVAILSNGGMQLLKILNTITVDVRASADTYGTDLVLQKYSAFSMRRLTTIVWMGSNVYNGN